MPAVAPEPPARRRRARTKAEGPAAELAAAPAAPVRAITPSRATFALASFAVGALLIAVGVLLVFGAGWAFVALGTLIFAVGVGAVI